MSLRLSFVFLALLSFGRADETLVPIAPPGFRVDLIAREPLVRNPCAMAFDARGRLFVGQGPQYRLPKPDTPGDTIEILLDRDGDGIAEATKTFARNLNNIQGLAWRGRDLWVANAPDLTIVRDLNGDDEADEYVRVFTDLGNLEHGLHGLVWGPDGKLYMSKGNSKGLNLPGRAAPNAFRELFDLPLPPHGPETTPPATFTAQNYVKAFHDPADDWGRTGGILRCDDLGANLEIVARGFRNPWDVAFDSGFNWLGTDNDQSDGDRVFMPFFGAHFGWAHAWSPHWTGEGHLPTVPLSARIFTGSGTGLVYNAAPGWPAEYQRVWFINDFLHRTIYVYRPTWDGALLKPEGGAWAPFVQGGKSLFRPIDVEQGPDGALYVSGWGSSLLAKYKDGELINEGRVFRIAPASLGPRAVPKKYARPSSEWTFEELAEDLGSHVAVWRVNAADELVRRGDAVRAPLQTLLESGASSEAQETWALWTLGRIGRSTTDVDAWLASKGRLLSANARMQAIRIVAHRVREWQHGVALPAFVAAGLRDAEPRLRFTAAQAIMQARARSLVPELWNFVAQETDRIAFYAGWRALHELATPDQLSSALRDARAGVRRAALLALLERGALGESEVRARLTDSDRDTAALAALWLAKRQGNSLLVIEPPPGDFTDQVRINITPGLKPSKVSFTTDGTEPDPAKGEHVGRLTMTDTTTVKAALFVEGKKVGNTAVATWRKRVPAEAARVDLQPPAQPTVLADVMPLIAQADRARGRALFGAAGCAACHRVNGTGGIFGPDLSGWSARADAEHVVRSMLEPNATITEGYALLSITKRNGETVGGRLHEESATVLTMVLPDGATVAIPRAEIAKRESLHSSPMPAFDRVLTARDTADITAWLLADGS